MQPNFAHEDQDWCVGVAILLSINYIYSANQSTIAFFTLDPTPISPCIMDKMKDVLILYGKRIIAHKHTSSIQHVYLWPIHLK